MSILDRILLTIYMILMILLSVFIIVIPFKVIPIQDINYIVGQLYSNWYYCLFGIVLLLISIKLLVSGVKNNNDQKRGIIKVMEFGDMKISVDTFESLALKATKQISGIRDVQIRVNICESGVIIKAKLLVLPDINIPKMVNEVQEKIKNYIESITEISVVEVKVDVDNLTLSTVRVE